MRIIEVALRQATPRRENSRSISSLLEGREYGSAGRSSFEKPRIHTTNLRVGRSNRSGRASKIRSVPDTWVTVYTGDIGNTLVVSCHRRALTKPPARYGAKGARFASGFVSRRSCCRDSLVLARRGFPEVLACRSRGRSNRDRSP